MKAALAKAYAFVTDEKFGKLVSAAKNGLLVALMLGLLFDLITPEKFHTLREAVLAMAF